MAKKQVPLLTEKQKNLLLLPDNILLQQKLTGAVGGFKNSNRMMLIASGIIALHFILKLVFNIDHTVYLLFPVFIFYVYILTIGRKKYVNLTEM